MLSHLLRIFSVMFYEDFVRNLFYGFTLNFCLKKGRCNVQLTGLLTYGTAVCAVKNSWWWTEELSETCRVYSKNKFEKLLHLVGFIIRKTEWPAATWSTRMSRSPNINCVCVWCVCVCGVRVWMCGCVCLCLLNPPEQNSWVRHWQKPKCLAG